MHSARIGTLDELVDFRLAARRLLAAGITPHEVLWEEGASAALFDSTLPEADAPVAVSARFVSLANCVARHRDAQRWPLLYEALWRMTHGERALLDMPTDPLVHRLGRMRQAVDRDMHRMTAFVRFREVASGDGAQFVAWYEPAHRVLRATAPFFIDRFASMRFSILTPDGSLHWDKAEMQFGPAVPREQAPSEDGLEAWWQRYYAATFNPARSNPDAMRTHLPKRFWRNLPEARLIPELLEGAGRRTGAMLKDRA